MAVGRGTAEVTFGALPARSTHTSVTVTGQTGLVAGANTQIEAWVRAEATAEHSVDEIVACPPRVVARVTGTGAFRIDAVTHDGRLDHGRYKIDWIWST